MMTRKKEKKRRRKTKTHTQERKGTREGGMNYTNEFSCSLPGEKKRGGGERDKVKKEKKKRE